MSTAETLARVDRSRDRLDKYLDFTVRREMQARADEAADREAERRDKMSRWDAACARHQAKYQDAYDKWGMQAPARIADEAPGDYRRRLFKGLQDKLPLNDDLEGVDPEELGSDVIAIMERQLLERVGEEGDNPTGTNLPDSVDDPRAKRERIDSATGKRTIEWKAKRSFIADMPVRVQRVVRFIDPVKKIVLAGEEFPRAPLPR
jgi:hypothetical protein